MAEAALAIALGLSLAAALALSIVEVRVWIMVLTQNRKKGEYVEEITGLSWLTVYYPGPSSGLSATASRGWDHESKNRPYA